MAHLTSPVGYRVGKTYLWSSNHLIPNNRSVLLNATSTIGLSTVGSWLLRRYGYYLLTGSITGSMAAYFIYYPMISPLVRKKQFFIYSNYLSFLNLSRVYRSLKPVMNTLWAFRVAELARGAVVIKKRKFLNKWLTQMMFRGSVFRKQRGARLKRRSQWSRSHLVLFNNQIARVIQSRVGLTIKPRLINIFRYLIAKFGLLTLKTHQNHLWKIYHRNKKYFTAYYDVVNALYILSSFPNMGQFVITMVQYALIKMHRRKIKPKRFFYFIDSVVKNMPSINAYFQACRIIITGKLKGGTARTGVFSAGYGIIPRQSLALDISMAVGDIRSKYGAFGVRVLTFKKMNYLTSQ